MSLLKIIIPAALYVFVFILSSCNRKENGGVHQNLDTILVDTLLSDTACAETDSLDKESLAFWLQDSLPKQDSLLYKAIDPIRKYRYCRYKTINCKDLLKDLDWSRRTRDDILELYSKTSLKDNELRMFFECLFKRARTMMHIDIDKSALKITENIDLDNRLIRFQTYLYLQCLLDLLDKDAVGGMNSMNREYCSSETLCDAAIDFCDKLSHLNYWGGTMSVIASFSSAYSIREAQMDLYKEEIKQPFYSESAMHEMSIPDVYSQLQRSSAMVLQQMRDADISWLENKDGYYKTIKEAEAAREMMLSLAFETFTHYRKERVEHWIHGEDEKFIRASNQRALNFITKINDIVLSYDELKIQ